MKIKKETANEGRLISDTVKVAASQAIMEPTPPSLGVRKRRKKTISDLLPIDLVMEIFKRLPVKTLARLICVSKLCASIIRSRDFMKMFLTNRHGRLFFTFKRYKDSILFTASLQTLNPCEASVAMTHPAFDVDAKNCSYLHGLICYASACASRVLVYNSSTRKLTTLPIFQPGTPVRNHFLGYDGIGGVYKVLCRTGPNPVFQIMTLGDGSSWKTVNVGQYSHFPLKKHICIDGVLYYEACADKNLKGTAFIMRFDVRSESFERVKMSGDNVKCSAMVTYEGKLAIISKVISADGGVVLWVLEDAVKHKWLKKVFVLPNSWTSLVQGQSTAAYWFHRFVDVNDAGEFVLAPSSVRIRHYVLFYDPKRNSMRKVAVNGIKVPIRYDSNRRFNRPDSCSLLHLFSSQVESPMFL